MKEIVVISGRDETGKTGLTASFAVLAGRPVIPDCDVDATDLHLVLSARITDRHNPRGVNEAVICQKDYKGYLTHMSLLQNCLSSPNVSIGDMVFQAVRTRFPLRIATGMTELGLLQEPHMEHIAFYACRRQ